jgi:hypothetical protein
MEIKKTTVYSINLNGKCFTLSDQEAKELYNELKILLDVRPAPVTATPYWIPPTSGDMPPTYQTPVWYGNFNIKTQNEQETDK